MQLKHLFENFNEQDETTQRTMVAKYRTRRGEEFEADRLAHINKQSRSKRAPKLDLTDEEKALMKMLGLKPADIRALRAAQPTEDE